MVTIESTLKLVDQYPERMDFVGGVQRPQIDHAEQKLGIQFSTSYRTFLQTLGCGYFGGTEFYGLGVAEIGVPNCVWVTQDTRSREPEFPSEFVVVHDFGFEGELFCLDTSRRDIHNECPVVSWISGLSKQHQPLETIASTFAEFFENEVHAAIK